MSSRLDREIAAPTVSTMAASAQLLRRLPYYALALIAFYLVYLVSLIGKSEGDVVVVRTPKGDVEYEVDRIEHL